MYSKATQLEFVCPPPHVTLRMLSEWLFAAEPVNCINVGGHVALLSGSYCPFEICYSLHFSKENNCKNPSTR